jgi:hypothetical protein
MGKSTCLRAAVKMEGTGAPESLALALEPIEREVVRAELHNLEATILDAIATTANRPHSAAVVRLQEARHAELAEVRRLADQLNSQTKGTGRVQLEGPSDVLGDVIVGAAVLAVGNLQEDLTSFCGADGKAESLRNAAHVAVACIETLVDCGCVGERLSNPVGS